MRTLLYYVYLSPWSLGLIPFLNSSNKLNGSSTIRITGPNPTQQGTVARVASSFRRLILDVTSRRRINHRSSIMDGIRMGSVLDVSVSIMDGIRMESSLDPS